MSETKPLTLLDCDAGRRLGCKSFCCRLLVRLEECERNEYDPVTGRARGFVEKKQNGTCIHQDESTGLCQNWENRPRICRKYDCNHDKLLQTIFNSQAETLTEWVIESVSKPVDKENYQYVPYITLDE